jgi:peptidyl-prolyl cis-trans isomerase A (cyclophilin A)
VIDRFIVQAGSFRPDMSQKRSYDPIANESDNGLKNERGTVAMARGFKPDSATSEFFINLNDNKTLNYYNQEPGLRGYCVFGRVIRGMEVLDRIAQVPTRVEGKLTDLPAQQVVIQKAEVLTTPIVAEQPSKAAATDPANSKSAKPSKNSKPGKKGKKRG